MSQPENSSLPHSRFNHLKILQPLDLKQFSGSLKAYNFLIPQRKGVRYENQNRFIRPPPRAALNRARPEKQQPSR